MTLPYMQFFPKDWIADTRQLTPEERGCYIDLMSLIWKDGDIGKLEIPSPELARFLGLEEEKTLGIVRSLFKKRVIGLETNLTDDLKISNVSLTLFQRRISRDQKDLENNRIRQKRYYDKHKPNANITAKIPDTRYQIPDKDITDSCRTAGPTPAHLVALWNKTADSKLPRVLALSDSRSAKCRLRLSEHPELSFWESVIEKINQSPFLLGDNSNGWKAKMDFLIDNQTNVLKILEGNYDGKRGR